MKVIELPQVIQNLFSQYNDLKVTDNNVVVLSASQYSNIFWQLLRLQQLNKTKNAEEHLIEVLNQYIASNRAHYPSNFSIRNPVRLKRPSPPARQSTLEMMQQIEKLDAFFIDSLSDPGRTPIFHLGRLMYSAMRYGGLLRNDLLSDLSQKLRHDVPLCLDKVIWFELKGAAGEVHIWQPDAMTVKLLSQWYRFPERTVSDRNFLQYINHFQSHAFPGVKLRSGVKWWVQAIRARLSLEITPYSLDIMTGAQPNLTLKPQVFYRLLSQKSNNKALNEIDFSDSSLTDVPTIKALRLSSLPVQTNEQIVKSTLKDIKAYLRLAKVNPDKNNEQEPLAPSEIAKLIMVQLDKVQVYLPPVIHYLLRWTSVRLVSQSQWSGKLGAGTLISYLDTIAMPMWLSLGDVDLASLEPDALEEVYAEFIDDGPSLRSRGRRAQILRDFHIYMEDQHQLEPCYLFQQHIARGQKYASLAVDANILMPWEYELALDFLLQRSEQQTGLSHDHARALAVLLLLGFRCGLRRREALYLRMTDIENVKDPDSDVLSDFSTIYVTPHQHRSLKTRSAERRIPLGLLLNRSEKAVFYQFLQSRTALDVERSPYLFYAGTEAPLGDPNRLTISQTLLFEPLTTLLQRITGDDTFRFHHLRHSFASWMHWSWMESSGRGYKAPLCLLDNLPQFAHLTKAKRVLFHHDSHQPTRKTLHLISALIGHSGPSMTLFHYIHSASWTLWTDLNTLAPALSRTDEAILANVDVRTVSRARMGIADKNNVYQGMSAYMATQLLSRCEKLKLKGWKDTRQKTPAALNIATPEQTLELDIYIALLRHINHGESLEQCALDVNVSVDRLQVAYKNALIFFAQEFNSNSKFQNKKRPRNYKTFKYSGGTRVPLAPTAHLPELPASSKSFGVALSMLKRFNELSVQEQKKVMWAAQYVVTRCSVNWPHFRIYEPGLLHRFIEAMELLGQSVDVQRRMRFTLTARAPHQSEDRIIKWRLLSLDNFKNQDRDNRSDKNYSLKGYLSIDYKSFDGSIKSRESKRKARGKTSVQHRRPQSEYGIRFGLYMIFITGYIPSSEALLCKPGSDGYSGKSENQGTLIEV